ncbi:DUF1365 family protein [Vibrio sp. CAIM 722]|uniref:DUF1365 family protein n=1 Tax=Vibrio eleionomae TaxID=2653505 RepID=A0A7X4LPA1_9VIBR|nr:DUF1365 family protein [Vibrio eleionomae]MZI95101.1 DUF1365 family protein [Vibrio eleionomae]
MVIKHSHLFVGEVKHSRYVPIKHSLKYGLFMPCIDLDEWPDLQSRVWGLGERWWHWARLKRSDYVGNGDLKQAVLDKVYQLTGERFSGRVSAVLHLRYLGLYFSPVNFYYIYDENDVWQYLLAEVSNTPWNERHYYAIPADEGEHRENWVHNKAFHVSPFNPIQQQYHWRLKPLQQRLFIHLACYRDQKEFDATMLLSARPFQSTELIRLLLRTPIMTVKVMAGIYWEACKLWWKGAPIYDHPNRTKKTDKQDKENPSC